MHITENTEHFLRILPVFDSFRFSEQETCRLAHLAINRLIAVDKLPKNKKELHSLNLVNGVPPAQRLASTLLKMGGLSPYLNDVPLGPEKPKQDEVHLGILGQDACVMTMLDDAPPFKLINEELLPFGNNGHFLRDDGTNITVVLAQAQ